MIANEFILNEYLYYKKNTLFLSQILQRIYAKFSIDTIRAIQTRHSLSSKYWLQKVAVPYVMRQPL